MESGHCDLTFEDRTPSFPGSKQMGFPCWSIMSNVLIWLPKRLSVLYE
jgi:hypothetical protein